MSKMTFYTNPFSRGRTVRWMLEEIGEPYDVKVMEFDGNIKSAEYLAINPMGKVPALVHGDTIVTEVVAICAYLADQFPQKNLAPPPTNKNRGAYYRCLFFVAGPLEMAMTATGFKWDINDEMASTVGCGRIDDVVKTLEILLSGNAFVCGEQFTAADLVLSSYIGWAISQKNLPERPVFMRYIARAKDRPAAKRAEELDNELGALPQ
jgi:glutathione S-transferase